MNREEVKRANAYLDKIERVVSVPDAKKFATDVMLLPKNVTLSVQDNSNVMTIGFNTEKDSKAKDMLRIIEIEDAFTAKYKETNVISPSVYVHSLEDKPWHITTQAILITVLDEKMLQWVRKENEASEAHYSKHSMDRFWLPCSKPIEKVEKDVVCIFNRRISGWDGSIDRPVIELLGAGGHLQAVWNDDECKFKSLPLYENLKKEFDEEIGLGIKPNDIHVVGGFKNDFSHELVVLSCIYINPEKLIDIQKYALNNFDEDTDGVYLGTFTESLNYYIENPEFFAGGIKSAKTNFPNNKVIMDRLRKILREDLIQ